MWLAIALCMVANGTGFYFGSRSMRAHRRSRLPGRRCNPSSFRSKECPAWRARRVRYDGSLVTPERLAGVISEIAYQAGAPAPKVARSGPTYRKRAQSPKKIFAFQSNFAPYAEQVFFKSMQYSASIQKKLMNLCSFNPLRSMPRCPEGSRPSQGFFHYFRNTGVKIS
jgi:hypothetical protein